MIYHKAPSKNITLNQYLDGVVDKDQIQLACSSMASDHSGPLRVLMVTARYFPLMGGLENHIYQVARRIVQKGVDVTVLTTDLTGELLAHEQIDGVAIRRVRGWPAQRDYYFAPDIYRQIRSGRWDIVHIQSYHTFVAPLAMLAALHANMPYVVTFHGGGHSSRARKALRQVQWALLRPLLKRAHRLIAIAKFEVEFYGKKLRLSEDQFAFIPNGADLPKPSQVHTISDHALIASVGRLEQYKGHHRILAALPRIIERRPDVRLWIAGTGPYEAALRDLAKELGVANFVEIRAIPPRDRQTMATELSKVALMVLLSEYETHPIAVLEALALGRPVLVANTSGLRELAESGLVRAIALESAPEQLAAAVLDQLERPLIPTNLELPTWDDCAASLLELYTSVIRRTQCAS